MPMISQIYMIWLDVPYWSLEMVVQDNWNGETEAERKLTERKQLVKDQSEVGGI